MWVTIMCKPMEVYLSGLEWTKTHDNMGGVMGNIVFKDNMSYEEYQELFKTTYFVLCDKDYITNLQKDLEKANDIIAKDRQFYKSRMDEYVELKKENERLKEENKHIFSKVNDDKLLISNAMNYAEAQDYKSRVEKAVELLKNKKEKYKNMTDYHQYYVEGYDKAIELTHSSHSGIMLETIRSATIKNCDDLLNILDDGSDCK